MILNELITKLEAAAPLDLQESYDNSGLLIGFPEKEINKALITLDINDAIVDEAIQTDCDLIIAHHPLIFKGLKQLTGNTMTERLVIRLIKKDIAVYAIHTNLDNIHTGVNNMLAKKLGLKNLKILSPGKGNLKKLVTYCPTDQAAQLRDAIFKAGAGHIGNYDSCSFNGSGQGTFRALEGTNPYVGQKGELHFESEIRIETIVPGSILNKVITAVIKAHPYEEVAYDIYPLDNIDSKTGAGMIGELDTPKSGIEVLKDVKEILSCKVIKFSGQSKKQVKRVAICGGSGAFLIGKACSAGADLYITGDIKYHDYFDFEEKMILADAGHYETEQFTKELLYSILKKNFPTFALLISKIDTNPVDVL